MNNIYKLYSRAQLLSKVMRIDKLLDANVTKHVQTVINQEILILESIFQINS